MYCIDLTDPDPMKAYDTVRGEFEAFSPALLTKPEIILLTKADLVAPEVVKKVRALFVKKGKKVLTCSIYDPASISRLKKTLTPQKAFETRG